MNHLLTTIFENHSTFYMEVCIDPFNKRIRVDDYRGNIKQILVRAEELVKQHQVEKLIIKARMEDTISLFEFGLQPEAIVDHYFRGSDAYFYTKYYISDRKKNDHWMTEDAIIHSIYQLDHVQQNLTPPKDYEIKKADESQATKLSALYRQVFQIYPTPLNDPEYIKKTMQSGTIYYVFLHQGDIVSAASAEINDFYKNAELTDCATLPEHRKYGLMKLLLNELEGELIKKGIFCSYSIARSLSFGMNAALYQLGYSYRGRLMNNVYIYDKLEDMNMWVKNLAGC
ncbi:MULTISPECIES: putative beta-lysine N-acetyltransferase [Neobacillus]|uniref:Beta-lysine N-acetyltransferase n=1 Tax=Neobacillus rhizophilus TaxID=2833579 RepID=A0A942UC46_9BACI|nr:MULTISPECIES: putative beta-lysine N-acetyltransferase [Neobacillus]MBS4215988.1 putative beta-lysine N-acetyltransferase [Neobacillus rhizophilus]